MLWTFFMCLKSKQKLNPCVTFSSSLVAVNLFETQSKLSLILLQGLKLCQIQSQCIWRQQTIHMLPLETCKILLFCPAIKYMNYPNKYTLLNNLAAIIEAFVLSGHSFFMEQQFNLHDFCTKME